jgi:hypothetical protein
VNWRHRIAVVMLMCLAALPLAGAICAMTCLSGTTAVASHHQDGQDCENSMPASASASAGTASESGAKIGALSAHHCGTHDAVLPQVAATDVRRADLAVIAAPATSDPIDPLFGSVDTLGSVFQYTPPHGTAPPTTTPLVLRV